jgi:hypothetical protein
MPLLNVIFKDQATYLAAEAFFNTTSDFSHAGTNEETMMLSFVVADEADADSLEFYLTQEIQGETALQGYHFEYED